MIYLVILFVLFVLFLTIRLNLVKLLLCWCDLDLVSYYLVIYYQNCTFYKAGVLACLGNWVGV